MSPFIRVSRLVFGLCLTAFLATEASASVTVQISNSAQRMERMWYSRKYHMSPMPYSLFFRGGYAIHGTNSIRQLGRPASHGCVRLHPGNAAALYRLVQSRGGARIVVTH